LPGVSGRINWVGGRKNAPGLSRPGSLLRL